MGFATANAGVTAGSPALGPRAVRDRELAGARATLSDHHASDHDLLVACSAIMTWSQDTAEKARASDLFKLLKGETQNG